MPPLLMRRPRRSGWHQKHSAGSVSSPSIRWFDRSITIILLTISKRREIMADIVQDPLARLSEALAERASFARHLVAGISAQGNRRRSGTLWRKDVIVASEQ